MKNKYKNDLIEALNRMDELIEKTGETLEERRQQAKDYDLLFKFITRTYEALKSLVEAIEYNTETVNVGHNRDEYAPVVRKQYIADELEQVKTWLDEVVKDYKCTDPTCINCDNTMEGLCDNCK